MERNINLIKFLNVNLLHFENSISAVSLLVHIQQKDTSDKKHKRKNIKITRAGSKKIAQK